jgi:hypothetical protein
MLDPVQYASGRRIQPNSDVKYTIRSSASLLA